MSHLAVLLDSNYLLSFIESISCEPFCEENIDKIYFDAYLSERVNILTYLVQRYGTDKFWNDTSLFFPRVLYGNCEKTLEFTYKTFPDIIMRYLTFTFINTAFMENNTDVIQNLLKVAVKCGHDVSKIFIDVIKSGKPCLVKIISNIVWRAIPSSVIERAIEISINNNFSIILHHISYVYYDILSRETLETLGFYAASKNDWWIAKNVFKNPDLFSENFVKKCNSNFICDFFPELFIKTTTGAYFKPDYITLIKNVTYNEICDICFENDRDTTFICGHQICTNCYNQMKVKYCHMCRREIVIIHTKNIE